MTKLCREFGLRISERLKRARQVLTWISYAARPLIVTELQHALAVKPGDNAMNEEGLLNEDLLVSVCARIVTFDPERKIVRLVNYTNQEYIERVRISLFSTGQQEITRTCLIYLSFEVFEKNCYEESDDHVATPVFHARILENPFCLYAAQYWGIHAQGGAEKILNESILSFLGQELNLASAVQAMGLLSSKGPALWLAAYFGL